MDEKSSKQISLNISFSIDIATEKQKKKYIYARMKAGRKREGSIL